jgi:hypothetical protein
MPLPKFVSSFLCFLFFQLLFRFFSIFFKLSSTLLIQYKILPNLTHYSLLFYMHCLQHQSNLGSFNASALLPTSISPWGSLHLFCRFRTILPPPTFLSLPPSTLQLVHLPSYPRNHSLPTGASFHSCLSAIASFNLTASPSSLLSASSQSSYNCLLPLLPFCHCHLQPSASPSSLFSSPSQSSYSCLF